MRKWLLVLAVGVLVLGPSAVALAQQAPPMAPEGSVSYNTPGVINMDKGSGKLDTTPGYGGPKVFGPPEVYGPSDTTQKGWTNVDYKK
jgi:hypothetical protein